MGRQVFWFYGESTSYGGGGLGGKRFKNATRVWWQDNWEAVVHICGGSTRRQVERWINGTRWPLSISFSRKRFVSTWRQRHQGIQVFFFCTNDWANGTAVSSTAVLLMPCDHSGMRILSRACAPLFHCARLFHSLLKITWKSEHAPCCTSSDVHLDLNLKF